MFRPEVFIVLFIIVSFALVFRRQVEIIGRAVITIPRLMFSSFPLSSHIKSENTQIPYGESNLRGILYYIPSLKPRPALLLVHGANPDGMDNPFLNHVAKVFAASGFTTMLADFTFAKQMKMKPQITNQVEVVFQALVNRPDVDERAAGIMGISFSGPASIIAATRPSIKSKVKFVISFGGYYDSYALALYHLAGKYPYAQTLSSPADGRWVFLEKNTDFATNPRDQEILLKIAQRKRKNLTADVSDMEKCLSQEGHQFLSLITCKDYSRTLALLSPYQRNILKSQSTDRFLERFSGHLIILHSRNDSLSPYFESVRLAKAAKRMHISHKLFLIDLFSHVHFSWRQTGVLALYTFYIPETIKLFSCACEVLRQRYPTTKT